MTEQSTPDEEIKQLKGRLQDVVNLLEDVGAEMLPDANFVIVATLTTSCNERLHGMTHNHHCGICMFKVIETVRTQMIKKLREKFSQEQKDAGSKLH